MRILVVTNLYPPHGVGGYEERCRTVVEGLRARGHTVTVLASDYVRGEQVPWERHIARELWLNGLFEAPMRSFAAVEAIEEQNHEVLRTWLRRTSPEVVYVWNLGGLSKSLLLTLRREGIPHRVDVGDPWLARTWTKDPWLGFWNRPQTRGEQFGRWWRERLGVRKRVEANLPTGPLDGLDPAACLFGSKHLRAEAAAAGWAVDAATVLTGGVPLDQVRVREDRPQGRRILWIGRIQPERGAGTALEALALLHRQGDRAWTLDFLGRSDRAYQDRLEADARRLGVLAAVSFRAASAERRRELYADYDVFCATDGGGSAAGLLTVWEARIAGLPTVLARRDGYLELLEGEAGRWGFEAGSAAELAATLTALAADSPRTLAAVADLQEKTRREQGLEPYLTAVERHLESAYAGRAPP